MKKIHLLLSASLLAVSVSFGANHITLTKQYSRGDDDKSSYTYRTAFVTSQLTLERSENGIKAWVGFRATLSTPEAQGFAESVRFGLREAKRWLNSEAIAIATEPVVFKFKEAAIQQRAEALSNDALRTGAAVPGNVAEADGQEMGGTIYLGELGEGRHAGTIYVQQLVGQQPSAVDTDISVRHLIPWQVKIQNNDVAVEIRSDNRYYATNATVAIAAPAWDNTIRPHRVELTRDQINIDGRTYLSGTARYGAIHTTKEQMLRQRDRREYKREYTPAERREMRRRGQ